MDQTKPFNLSADLLGDYSSIFMKLVFLIIVVYIIVMILNFLRDKFINTPTDSKKDDISGLLIILNKLFFVSGFGFIVANIFQFLLSQATRNGMGFQSMNFKGEWDYLAFGIILIFVGVGAKLGKNALKNEKAVNAGE